MSQGTFQTRALYLQLSDVLIERMANGTWKPGTSLPSEQELAREFGVSTGTVRKALEVLVDMRLVTRRQGRGTFVSDQTSDEAGLRFVRLRTASGSHVFGHIRSIEITDGNATEVECRRLALQAGDKVHRISRTRIDNKTPFMIERASVPAKLFPDLADKVDFTDRIVALARHYGIFLGKATEQITIEPVSAEIAHGLGVSKSTTIAVLDRVSLALDGTPVEWRKAWCNLDGRYYLAELG